MAIEKSVQIALIIGICAIVIGGIGAYVFLQTKTPSNTITVQGQASLKVDPDTITTYFRIEATGQTAAEAKDKSSEIYESAVTSLTNLGIAKEKIQTENINIYPEYDWIDGQQKFRDFKATHSFKVELGVPELEKLGKVFDAGVNSGALIDYVSFELSQAKQNEYKVAALKQASEDAKVKAEAIASGQNRKLGKLVSISDISFDYYPLPIYRAEESAGKTAKEALAGITPSQLEVTARVSAVYQIS